MRKETLKPCPFCGGQAYIEDISNNEIEDDEYYMICCKECSASACFGDYSITKEGAVRKWNNRHNEISVVQNGESCTAIENNGTLTMNL